MSIVFTEMEDFAEGKPKGQDRSLGGDNSG
jgi:hypothetical protein